MSETVTAPSGASENVGLDSAVDSLLSATTETTESTETVEPTETTEVTETVEPGAEATEEPVEAAPAADEIPETDEDLDKAMLGEQPNNLDLKTSRGKMVYGAYKNYKAVKEALGQDLSAEDAVQHFQAFSDKAAMEFEFGSGDPAKAANWLRHWNQQSPQGMATVAAQFADAMARYNLPAYQELALPVLNRYINAMYQRSQDAGLDAKTRESLLYTARAMDYDLNQRFRADAELKAADPLAAREQSVNERFQQIQNFERQQAQERFASWDRTVDQKIDGDLDAQAEKSLSHLKPAYAPRVFASLKRDLIEAVVSRVAQDKDSYRLAQIQQGELRKVASQEGADAAAKLYLNLASRALPFVLPNFLKEAGITAKNQADARNKQLSAAAQAGKAPTSSGPARLKSIAPQTRQYASKGEQLDDTVDQLLGVKR